MSASTAGTESKSQSTTNGDADEGTDAKQARLRSYLRERAAEGEVYFKSKFIAEDVGLSPKEIGALMVNLKDTASDLDVEKWSYTGATTWRVTQA